MKRLFPAGILIVALVVTGCTKNSDSTVLARVNRATITVADFKRQIEDLDDPQIQQAVRTNPKAQKEFLEQLIGYELALQEARRQGFDKDADFKKRQKQLKKEMEKRKKQMDWKIQEATKLELLNKLFEKEFKDKVALPTDREAKEYYNAHKEEMRSAGGKMLSFKEAEQRGLKNYVFQRKQRDAFIKYTNELKAKSKVTTDAQALESLGKTLSQPSGQEELFKQLPTPPHGQGKQKEGAEMKEETKK